MSQISLPRFLHFQEINVTKLLLHNPLSVVCVNWKKSRGGPMGSRAYRGMPNMQMPAMQMPMPMVSYPQVAPLDLIDLVNWIRLDKAISCSTF